MTDSTAAFCQDCPPEAHGGNYSCDSCLAVVAWEGEMPDVCLRCGGPLVKPGKTDKTCPWCFAAPRRRHETWCPCSAASRRRVRAAYRISDEAGMDEYERVRMEAAPLSVAKEAYRG